MKLERLLFIAASIALAACDDATAHSSDTETHLECTGSDDCIALGSDLECSEGRCRTAAADGGSGPGGQSGGGGSGSGGQSAGEDGGNGVCQAVGAVCEAHSACCGFEEMDALCVDADGPSEGEPAKCFSTCEDADGCPSGFRCRATNVGPSLCVAIQ